MIPWKLAPYIGGFIAAIALTGYIHHKGVVSGRAQIQARFDSYVKASDDMVAAVQRDAEAKESAARENNAKIISDYQLQLDTSRAFGLSIASRLREALAKASSSPVPQDPGAPGTSGTSPAPSLDTLASAVGDTAAECRNNADALDALIAELKPQL